MGAYKERAMSLFMRLDKNHDGNIDPADLGILARGTGDQRSDLARSTGQLVQGFIQDADRNKDSRASLDELAACVDKSMAGTTPETLPTYVRDFASTLFVVMDTDKSGKVDKAGFEAYLKAQGTSVDVAGREFEMLDRDHDGFLTRDDIQVAAHAFFTAPDGAPAFWLLAAVPA
ncbi:EF-hand domain-containing protein [Streptomyces sp. NPDC088261]|uniref:EF-hand domain-containing protein n=1 Tax=Streptomyces sp. NPDC088261 TaxID=3365851 RepID=UPI00380F6950